MVARRSNDKAVQAFLDAERTTLASSPLVHAADTADLLAFGTCEDVEGVLGVPLQRITAASGWVTGSTGSGKSYLLANLLLQLLPTADRPSCVVLLDLKGEISGIARETLLPAHIATLPADDATALSESIAVVDPFARGDRLPPLGVLTPTPGTNRAAQADAVAHGLGSMLGDGGPAGPRMMNLLQHLCQIGHALGLSLGQLRRVLVEDELRGPLSARLEDRRLIEWLRYGIEREPRASRASVASRLDRLLLIDSVRLSLAARSMVDFGALLSRPGVVIVDLGASAGQAPVRRLYSSVLFSALTSAILARPPAARSLPCFVFIDEAHLLLRQQPEAAQFTQDLLTQARWQNSSLWFCHQAVEQLAAVDSTLPSIMRQSVALEAHFRASVESARMLADILPVTGRRYRHRRPWEPPHSNPLLTDTEERSLRVRELSELPRRLFWMRYKHQPGPAVLGRSLEVDMGELERAANHVDPATRERCRHGVLAVPIADLERVHGERDAQLDALKLPPGPHTHPPRRPPNRPVGGGGARKTRPSSEPQSGSPVPEIG